MLKNIAEQFLTLEVYENRSVTDEYCELVFLNKDKARWHGICVASFGEPAKPEGKQPTEDDARITAEYGGIFKNQVLFKKADNGNTVIAMFWPWQDNAHTTLKMAVIK